MPEWKYETFFFTEFLPYIEKKYRIIDNKENRAIAGLSMGGGAEAQRYVLCSVSHECFDAAGRSVR